MHAGWSPILINSMDNMLLYVSVRCHCCQSLTWHEVIHFLMMYIINLLGNVWLEKFPVGKQACIHSF